MHSIFCRRSFVNCFYITFIIFCNLSNVYGASGGATKGEYKVYDKVTKNPCIILQGDIYLYLSYYTTDQQEKDAVIHVPTSSTVDDTVSSCDTIVTTSGLSVKAQLLRINLDHMDGWALDIAFTQDETFRTNNGQQYTIFQVNVTANYATYPSAFPGAGNETVVYYLPITTDLSTISESIYATNGNSFYCPSKQKYEINKNNRYGPYSYIQFALMYLQAYKTTAGTTFGEKETCPSDQHVTDLVPIIVGSSLAAFIFLTLVVYLIYRSCLPEEVINLVNPESHFENKAMNEEDPDSYSL